MLSIGIVALRQCVLILNDDLCRLKQLCNRHEEFSAVLACKHLLQLAGAVTQVGDELDEAGDQSLVLRDVDGADDD